MLAMSNMTAKTKRVWLIAFTGSDSRKYYGRVIAKTLEDALATIKEKYPNAIFVSANHHRAIDHE